MTERKFTPPTEFPAEYVDWEGNKAVIFGRGPNELFPFIGHNAAGHARYWTEEGLFSPIGANGYELHDIPKRITTWHNVYGDWVGTQFLTRELADEHHDSCKAIRSRPRLCVYRIERDEEGSSPEIFEEEA
jgi:hypothetical protein